MKSSEFKKRVICFVFSKECDGIQVEYNKEIILLFSILFILHDL